MNDSTSSTADIRSADGVSPEAKPELQSTVRRNAPRLTHRGLTSLLIGMCLIPTVVIFALWQYLPPVYEGQLEGDARTTNLPPDEFYARPFGDR
jgi:hypothetical protein